MKSFRRSLAAAALAILFATTTFVDSVRADETLSDHPPPPAWEDYRFSDFLNQIGRDFATPVRQPALTTLLYGTGISAAAYPFRHSIAREANEDQPLGSSSSVGYNLGLWKINFIYFAGYLTYGLIASDSAAVQKSALMFRASLYTGLVTTAIKDFHFEQRPRKNGDFNSFPSGHASNSFAFAGVIYRNHGLWLGIPAFAMAAFVGASRINDNAHYLHDVTFGATIGLCYSLGLDSEWFSSDHTKSLAVAPIAAHDGYGLSAVIDF